MDVITLNPKLEARKYVVNNFIMKRRNELYIDTDAFIDYIYDLRQIDFIKLNRFMMSLLVDAYEMLKWKQTLNKHNEKDNSFLDCLDDTKQLDQAIDIALSNEYIELLLSGVYSALDASFAESVNCKNNIRNVKTNEIILESDKYRALDENRFYQKNLIFSTDYKKEEYIYLYDAIQSGYGREEQSISGFVDVVYGMSLYNPANYKQLVIDMCAEFIYQKKIIDGTDEVDYYSDYLMYLLKYAKLDHILNVITQFRPVMESLAYGYANYDCFDEDMRKEFENGNVKKSEQKIIKKLYGSK